MSVSGVTGLRIFIENRDGRRHEVRSDEELEDFLIRVPHPAAPVSATTPSVEGREINIINTPSISADTTMKLKAAIAENIALAALPEQDFFPKPLHLLASQNVFSAASAAASPLEDEIVTSLKATETALLHLKDNLEAVEARLESATKEIARLTSNATEATFKILIGDIRLEAAETLVAAADTRAATADTRANAAEENLRNIEARLSIAEKRLAKAKIANLSSQSRAEAAEAQVKAYESSNRLKTIVREEYLIGPSGKKYTANIYACGCKDARAILTPIQDLKFPEKPETVLRRISDIISRCFKSQEDLMDLGVVPTPPDRLVEVKGSVFIGAACATTLFLLAGPVGGAVAIGAAALVSAVGHSFSPQKVDYKKAPLPQGTRNILESIIASQLSINYEATDKQIKELVQHQFKDYSPKTCESCK